MYISIHYILLSVSGICHWALFIVPAAIGWSLHDVRFLLIFQNLCCWLCFGLIPALSVNMTVHSVVYVAAGSYDRHRHIYRYFDFTPATGTAWFYINRKKL